MPYPKNKEEEAEIKLNTLRVIVDEITPEQAQKKYGWSDKMTSAVRDRLRKAIGLNKIYTQLEFLDSNFRARLKVLPSCKAQSKPSIPSSSGSPPRESESSQSDSLLLAKSFGEGE